MGATNGTSGGELYREVLRVLRGQTTREEAVARAGLPLEAFDAARADLLASKLPPANLTLRTGVRGPVRIVRDRSGTAHVYADDARDLFFGYGFALAQDRLWQIDYYRRRALGRLAEVLGSAALPSDRRNRRLGFGPIADRELEALSDEASVALDGFADGINAWIEQAQNALPIEFDILEYVPEPWTPCDSIALMRAFFWQLTGRLENLAAAEAAARVLGPDLAADFLTTEAPDETILPRSGSMARRLIGSGASGGGDAAGGSNNWAVAPGRSASGHAVLASDPHLPFMLPAGLYQIHLKGVGYDVAGAGYPGTPNVWFGHNDRVAWGITNLVASPRDLYVETLDPSDPDRYREGDGWATVETRTEEIGVRGGPPATVTIRSTVRGPLVDDLVPLPASPDGPGAPAALSLRWVGQEVLGDTQAVLDMNRARDWASFRAALSHWRLPVFNLVYADVDGHIGWQAVGSIPVRGEGDLTRGFRPADDPAHQWTGSIPFDDLPRLEDPERGWVATANNVPVAPDEQTVPLYGWWAPGYRATRLRQLFEGGDAFTADDLRAFQYDTQSIRAGQLLPRLRQILRAHGGEASRRLAGLLDGWDGRMTVESAGAAAFEAFFERWHQRVITARFPEDMSGFLVGLGAGSGLALRLLTEGHPADWLGAGTDVAALVGETAAEALADLERRLGPDPAAWRWGALHQVSFAHPLDGAPGSDDLFATAPREAPGTSVVLNANGFSHAAPFAVTSGPEYRLVVDMGDLDGATVILTTGQSGQPGSPHYQDMVDPWVQGQYVPLPFSDAAVSAAQAGETLLKPAS